MAASSTTATLRRPAERPQHRRGQRRWAAQAVQCGSAVRRQETPPWVTAWVDPEGITLSEVSRSQRKKLILVSLRISETNESTNKMQRTNGQWGGAGWVGRSGLPGRPGLAHCIFKTNKCPQTSVPICRHAEKAAWPPPLSGVSGDRPSPSTLLRLQSPRVWVSNTDYSSRPGIPGHSGCFRLLGCRSARRSSAAGSHSCVSLRMLPTGQ